MISLPKTKCRSNMENDPHQLSLKICNTFGMQERQHIIMTWTILHYWSMPGRHNSNVAITIIKCAVNVKLMVMENITYHKCYQNPWRVTAYLQFTQGECTLKLLSARPTVTYHLQNFTTLGWYPFIQCGICMYVNDLFRVTAEQQMIETVTYCYFANKLFLQYVPKI